MSEVASTACEVDGGQFEVPFTMQTAGAPLYQASTDSCGSLDAEDMPQKPWETGYPAHSELQVAWSSLRPKIFS